MPRVRGQISPTEKSVLAATPKALILRRRDTPPHETVVCQKHSLAPISAVSEGGQALSTVGRSSERLRRAERLFDLADRFFDVAGAIGNAQFAPLADQAFDFALGGDDRRVAAAAEEFADFAQRGTRVFARQPHRQHPRFGDVPRFARTLETARLDAKHLADGPLDIHQPHGWRVLLDELRHRRAGQAGGDRLAVGLARGHEAVDRPLQLSGAAGDLRGDDRDDLFAGLLVDLFIFAEGDSHAGEELPHQADAGRVVGRQQGNRQPTRDA